MGKPAIHQFVPSFLYGDALGNQAGQIRALLREWGYASQVYAEYLDHRMEDPGRHYRSYSTNPDDVILLHVAVGTPVTRFAHSLPGRIVPYYHNITPPEFFRGYNERMVGTLTSGRQELALLNDAPFALAASEYNREEMLQLGFRGVEILPYFVGFDDLRASSRSASGREISKSLADRNVNILFVGRLVPNKRQDDLIRAFGAYHDLINPESRLLLVGSDDNAPGYRVELETMVDARGLNESVLMPGPVGPREGLGGYYEAADLFLCMSEHEGFCIPLVEAMAFDVPVLAFRSTGVPYAMGGAGLMVSAKRYGAIAELIDLLVGSEDLRERVLAGQRRRLQALAPDRVTEELRACVGRMVEPRDP